MAIFGLFVYMQPILILIECRIVIHLLLKGELLESSTVGDMAHKPAYFVPGNVLFCKSTVSFILLNVLFTTSMPTFSVSSLFVFE